MILTKDHERSFFIVFSLTSLFDYSFFFVPFFQHFFFALAHFLNMAIWHASRPTVIDSGIRGKVFWNRRFKFFDFGRGRGPHKGFRCCLVVAISFFFFALPVSLWKFSHFCSRPPFRVFTLKSCSFFPFSFFLHFSFFDCPIMNSTIQNSSQTSERLIKIFLLAEEKRQQPCWLWKISQGRKLFSPSIHVQSKWTF